MTLEERLEAAADRIADASRWVGSGGNDEDEEHYHQCLRLAWKDFYVVVRDVNDLVTMVMRKKK